MRGVARMSDEWRHRCSWRDLNVDLHIRPMCMAKVQTLSLVLCEHDEQKKGRNHRFHGICMTPA